MSLLPSQRMKVRWRRGEIMQTCTNHVLDGAWSYIAANPPYRMCPIFKERR